MAGISQKVAPVDVMPLLARNVYAQGYEGGSRQTEFLVLLNRYVQQARELTVLAGANGVIKGIPDGGLWVPSARIGANPSRREAFCLRISCDSRPGTFQ